MGPDPLLSSHADSQVDGGSVIFNRGSQGYPVDNHPCQLEGKSAWRMYDVTDFHTLMLVVVRIISATLLSATESHGHT